MPVSFKAALPRSVQVKDQICIRGMLRNNPCRISFNFIVNDNPLYVALHFKTHFGASIPADKAVVLNSKNVVWEEEHHHENSWQVGNSREFNFVFMFLDEGIRIYTGNSQNGINSYQYQFDHRLPFERITHLEVWDDMETVAELCFRYSNSSD